MELKYLYQKLRKFNIHVVEVEVEVVLDIEVEVVLEVEEEVVLEVEVVVVVEVVIEVEVEVVEMIIEMKIHKLKVNQLIFIFLYIYF